MNEQIAHIENLTKYFGSKLILDEVSLTINRQDRIALVGENGAGKTTLCRILLGAEEMDSGNIEFNASVITGYLPQETMFSANKTTTIRHYMEEATGHLRSIESQLKILEAEMADNASSDAIKDALMRYGTLQEEFMRRGGYELSHQIDRVFSGLKIQYLDQNRAIRSLSGGEKTRVALAGLLLQSPDFLILDEPTNHLDFETLQWLEEYLESYQHALMIISHDRRFINRVATKIAELSPITHRLTLYHGNYEDYLIERERVYEKRAAEYREQLAEIRQLQRLIRAKTCSRGKGKPPSDGDKFIKWGKGQQSDRTTSRDIQRAKTKLKQLENEPLKHPGRLWNIQFEFNSIPTSSAEAIRIRALRKQYGDHIIFENLNAILRGGERALMIGPNGCGKSALLKIIAGLEKPDQGEIKISASAQIGYLDQEQETLDLERTVFEIYRRAAQGTDRELLTQLHRNGLFSGDITAETRAGSLSIGQRRKLQLATIVASGADLLLLDEPTNHLDFDSLEALEQGLLKFKGTILAASHDRWFIEKIATEIWHFADKAIQIQSL